VRQLAQQNRELRRRGALAVALNTTLLVGLLCWLVWPGKTLTAERVYADQAVADSFGTFATRMRSDGSLVLRESDGAAIRLSVADPDAATFSLERGEYGQIVASVGNAPFIGLYADASTDPGSHQPQIELSLAGEDRSPRIVLRDLNGQVIWHAP
jgi:hypothetical protein